MVDRFTDTGSVTVVNTFGRCIISFIMRRHRHLISLMYDLRVVNLHDFCLFTSKILL